MSQLTRYSVQSFLVLQAVLLFSGLWLVGRSRSASVAERAAPPLRPHPLSVRPLYDDDRVITDGQLATVLQKLQPRLRTEKPKINHVDHALRMWGAAAQFSDLESLNGEEMRALLVNHQVYTQYWGATSSPLLLVDTDGRGIKVRTREGLNTASHVDHTMATLAEVGTPLEFVLQTSTGEARFGDLLEYSLSTFSLNQLEYEWSALTYALYFDNVRQWYSSEGQEVTFDRLAERIMRQELNQGVCMGHHRLYTLVVLLRVDEQSEMLSPSGRQTIVDHLTEATARLVGSQHPTGYWIKSWPSGLPPDTDDSPDAEDTLQNRILATGHALEWWALAPETVLPPREVVVRAGQWLSRAIQEMSPAEIQTNYTFLTHAGRALALWRGGFPADFLPTAGSSPSFTDETEL